MASHSQRWAAALVCACMLVVFERFPAFAAQMHDRFIVVNGVTLHYVDWGGRGAILLFLAGGGQSAHSYDAIAPQFTDRFRVLGLTRRGQGESDKPANGYDTDTLVEDIRAFCDTMQIQRVSLVGFSLAGNEQTHFASKHPDRLDRLVYLDAAYDQASNLAMAERSPLPAAPMPEGPAGALVRAAQRWRPDYSKVRAPALSIYALPDSFPVDPAWDVDTRRRMDLFFREFIQWIQGQISEFRTQVRAGEVVELAHTTHGDVLDSSETRRVIVERMRTFLRVD